MKIIMGRRRRGGKNYEEERKKLSPVSNFSSSILF